MTVFKGQDYLVVKIKTGIDLSLTTNVLVAWKPNSVRQVFNTAISLEDGPDKNGSTVTNSVLVYTFQPGDADVKAGKWQFQGVITHPDGRVSKTPIVEQYFESPI